jgi:hypothetical protein
LSRVDGAIGASRTTTVMSPAPDVGSCMTAPNAALAPTRPLPNRGSHPGICAAC